MSKNIRILYLYIVAFITIGMVTGGFISTVNYMASYFLPNTYYYGSYYPEKVDMGNTSSAQANTKVDYDKMLKEYKDNMQKEENRIRTQNLKNMLTSIAVLAISTPLFAYHWTRIEKERKEVEV